MSGTEVDFAFIILYYTNLLSHVTRTTEVLDNNLSVEFLSHHGGGADVAPGSPRGPTCPLTPPLTNVEDPRLNDFLDPIIIVVITAIT